MLLPTTPVELVALKSDPFLILASGAGALLEVGLDLHHLWTTQIQAANFIDVFRCPPAHH